MKLVKLSDKAVLEHLAELNFDDEILWRLEDGKLTKSFKFKDFKTALGFMTMCALYCEKIDHHPCWTNEYNRVSVQLITHSVEGITKKDFELGAMMDEISVSLIL